MLHKMKLNREPFEMINSGRKTIELRLNDEKRRKVQIGDFIEFSHIDKPELKIQVRVTALHYYKSFKELFAELPKEKCGFKSDKNVPDDYMDKFYPREKQEKYGALGIEFRKTELQKFIDAQDNGYNFGDTYETALNEMKKGMKISCWMWYVFPQIKGLGLSGTSAYFSINDLTEAVDYYEHPILGKRLIEITSEALKIDNDDPVAVFGIPDAYKLRSCMTLFKRASNNDIFQKALDKFCQGAEDEKTIDILNEGAN